MSKWIGSALLCAVFACGGGSGNSGGSGVDPNKALPDINSNEARDLCEYFADLEGAPREIDCGNGQTIDVGQDQDDIDECVDGIADSQAAFPDCPVTVGEAEACFEAINAISDDELCEGIEELPPECEDLFTDPLCAG